MPIPKPTHLITDLDNTLYDWVSFFALAFEAMVNELPRLVGVPKSQLLDEFKDVHTTYGLTELPFAALELPSVKRVFAHMEASEKSVHLAAAFRAFNDTRDAKLMLYPGVLASLETLQKNGVTLIACTESVAANAKFRLKKLGILPYFSKVYVLEGTLPPYPHATNDKPIHGDGPPFLEVRLTERKPDPALLQRICEAEGIVPAQAVYIGDSLTRDVLMGTRAGAKAVWAQYGTRLDDSVRQILMRVSHWTPEEVAREARLIEQTGEAAPALVADQFSDVLALFATAPLSGS